MNFFKNVAMAPSDAIFGLSQAFTADPREEKVNLVIGAYKTTDLKPLVLNCVKEAEAALLESEPHKEYLPIDGDPLFVRATKSLVLGRDLLSERVYGAQTVGGTAALRVAGRFLVEQGYRDIYLSEPTWDNHHRTFQHAGLSLHSYPYYDPKHHDFDFEALCAFLEEIPSKSVVLFHASCHNPTGFDPTVEQWETLCELTQRKELIPFFDCAYQGFGSGIKEDVASIRLFVEAGLDVVIAYSFSKNFGLYAERTGALLMVCGNGDEAERVGSQVKTLIRGMYSNPPCHGARVVAKILSDETLRQNWEEELADMRLRITEMRKAFLADLKIRTVGKSQSFDPIERQKGMFSYTGLEPDQVDRLIHDFGIYMTKSGRVNIAGLNSENMEYVTEAIASVAF